jgi:hypothetical protein
MRGACALKRDKITERRRDMHNEELHNLYTYTYRGHKIKEHVNYTWEIKTLFLYTLLIEKTKEKRPSAGQGDNIKVEVKD